MLKEKRYGGSPKGDGLRKFNNWNIPKDVDFVDVFDPAKMQEKEREEYAKIFERVKNEKDPDGETKEIECNGMVEALKVANALSLYHGEAQINKDDKTGRITVKSKGKNKGVFASS